MKPYRIKLYEETGKPIMELVDENPQKLIEKTRKAFKEKFA